MRMMSVAEDDAKAVKHATRDKKINRVSEP